jgi:transcriptional regulator with GAF, ATPase, and Fis domain
MGESGGLTAWLHCFDTHGSLCEREIVDDLRHEGVATEALNPEDPLSLGIIICDQVSGPVCDFIRRFSRHGLDLVLAVTTQEQVAGGGAWPLLEAGALDVLSWNGLERPAAMIAARLERWRAVDDIVKSPLVRRNLIGQSRVWMSVLRQVVEAARFTDASILLLGETGTGKELIARLINTLSPQRSKHDLIVLDCTTIVPELAGSELFGHERGAFTGAVAAREGAFALASSGTLFLDEVGELPLNLQAQLLRVVQERTYKRVGSNTWQKTDFRLVSATNRDLLEDEAHGQFRRDLYYRLASWIIRLPPLRERSEDILPLAQHFLEQALPQGEQLLLDEPVQEYLLNRNYPGNVRDLRNLALRMAYRHVGQGPVTIGAIPADERPPLAPSRNGWRDASFEQSIRRALLSKASLREIRHAAEDTAIFLALGDEEGNLQRAAKRLGLTDRALQMRRAEQRQFATLQEATG